MSDLDMRRRPAPVTPTFPKSVSQTAIGNISQHCKPPVCVIACSPSSCRGCADREVAA